MLLEYPLRAVPTLGWLKKPYNSIEIYVEDQACRRMYIECLQRMIGDHGKIASINQLGGRQKVINACRQDQAADGRRRLYIIDGDLGWLTGEKLPNLKYLHRLDYYCIENLLIDEEGCLNVCRVLDTNKTDNELSENLDFNSWIKSQISIGKNLYILFSITKLLSPHTKTIQEPILKYSKENGKRLDLSNKEIRKFFRLLIRTCVDCSNWKTFISIKKIVRKRADLVDGKQLVSGKDFLFPLVREHFKRFGSVRLSKDAMLVLMSQACSVSSDQRLQTRLRRIVS